MNNEQIMKPYKFNAYLKPTIWGGNKIAAFKGVDTAEENIGESWEISGVRGHENIAADRGISDDVDLGLNLTELIDKYKGKLVGERIYQQFGNQFPLLFKFIDSCQDLSVQVHPDDELAKKRHNCAGKTEMWYIMDTDPGSKIYSGLKRQITPEEYEEVIARNENPIDSFIACHEAHNGDLYYLPAGRLHAIGAGNFLAEIQETSDITYRVYDYDRKDANGNTRELHTAEARDAIDYTVFQEYRSNYDSTKKISSLVQCKHFNVNRVVVSESLRVDLQTDSFVVVMCISGNADINGIQVKQGETILVPACENVLHIFGDAVFLTASVDGQ